MLNIYPLADGIYKAPHFALLKSIPIIIDSDADFTPSQSHSILPVIKVGIDF